MVIHAISIFLFVLLWCPPTIVSPIQKQRVPISYNIFFTQGICSNYEYTDRNGIAVVWREAKDGEYIQPDNICITDSGKLNVKRCVGEEWTPFEHINCEVTKPQHFLDPKGTFYMYSSEPERYNELQFTKMLSYLVLNYEEHDFWYPCQKDNSNKFLTPYLCNYRSEFVIQQGRMMEEKCMIMRSKGVLEGANCDDKHYSLSMGNSIIQNPYSSGFSLTYEMNYSYGFDFEDADYMSLREYIHICNILLYFRETFEDIEEGRLFESTTFPEVDVVVDFDNSNFLTIEEIQSTKKRILLKHTVPEKDIVFTLADTHNGVYIELMIENYEYFWQLDLSKNRFTCFNDANYLTFVDVESVSSMNSTYFFRILLEPVQGLANYWCIGNSVFGLKTVESEKLLSGYLFQSFDQFAFYLTYVFNENSLIGNLLQDIGYTLQSDFAISNFEIFEILKSEKSSFFAHILCHIVVQDDIETVHRKLNQMFEFSYHGRVNSTTVCYETPLSSSNLDVVWVTTPINQEANLNSTRYMTRDNKPPTRKCIGAFPHGTAWESNDFADLVYNITGGLMELLRKLKLLTPLEIAHELDDLVENGKYSLNPEDYETIEKVGFCAL